MPALTQALVRHGAVEPLIAALPPADGPVLAKRIGVLRPLADAPAGIAKPVAEQALPAPLLSVPLRAALAAAVRTWGCEDARSLWFAATLVAAIHPAPLPAARLGRRARDEIYRVERIEAPSPARGRDARAPHEAQTPEMRLPRPHPPSANGSARDAPARRQPPPASAPVTAALERAPAALDMGVRTGAGGLLFALNALARLRFEAWLENHPATAEGGFGLQLLRALALDAGVDARDPMLLALPAPPEQAAAPQRALRLWRRALRRWVWRNAELTLAAVLRRSARLAASETHVDLYFDAGSADMRLRRCGLDIDPGWVAWLARVVRFHYGSADGA
jgi:hypothetical protein